MKYLFYIIVIPSLLIISFCFGFFYAEWERLNRTPQIPATAVPGIDFNGEVIIKGNSYYYGK